MLHLALAATLALLAAPPAPEPPREDDAELRARVEGLLGAIDTPVTAERWRALGPRAAPLLEEVAVSESEFPTRRARALEGLSAIGGPAAERLLLSTARAENEPFVVRASAIRGAGRLLSRDRLLAELRPVLQGAREARVRAVAAEVLARQVPGEGCAAVRAQVEREEATRRGPFGKALARCPR